jgi:hypothetical protein
MLLEPAVVHEVADLLAARGGHEVGQHPPVAAPPQALRAHHGRAVRIGQGQHLVHRGPERRAAHVRGVASQRPGLKRHVR